MLSIIIVFCFCIFCICEMTKYKRSKSFKEYINRESKEYNIPVVMIKFVSICITLVLLIINRFTSNGIMDRSMGLTNTIFYYVVIVLLILLSYRDVKRALSVKEN